MYMRAAYVDAHRHGRGLHRMSACHALDLNCRPYSFFSVSQYTCDIIVVPFCMNSTISTPFLSQKIVAISFLAGRLLFKLFLLVW
jgi:hypothetical protein